MAQQNQYPPPPYGGTPPQRSRGPLLLVIVLGLVLVIVVAVVAVLLVRNDDSKPSSAGKAGGRPSAPESVQFRSVIKTEQGDCTATPAPADTACDSEGNRYLLGKVELDGTRVTEVKAASAQGDTAWIVNLSLDDEGSQSFARLTTELATKTPPQNQLAIVVNGRVVSAPTVMSPITGGKVQISSNFTKQDAEKLADDITG